MFFSERKKLAEDAVKWLRDHEHKLNCEMPAVGELNPEITRRISVEPTPFNVITALNAMGYLRETPER